MNLHFSITSLQKGDPILSTDRELPRILCNILCVALPNSSNCWCCSGLGLELWLCRSDVRGLWREALPLSTARGKERQLRTRKPIAQSINQSIKPQQGKAPFDSVIHKVMVPFRSSSRQGQVVELSAAIYTHAYSQQKKREACDT